MPLPAVSMAIVGAGFPNKRGPGRLFELALCVPGEQVELRPEPRNPTDPRAVAVFSRRGIQLGYLSAERCGRIAAMIKQGREIRAVFQQRTSWGGVIRVAFDGENPELPLQHKDEPRSADDFWPDYIPPDD